MAYCVSERRACEVLTLPRTSHRYQSVADEQAAMRMRLKDLSRVPGSGVRGRGSGERETTASSLAQIHRRDDYAAAERAIGAREGDGPGTIWGRGGPVSVFSCRGETL